MKKTLQKIIRTLFILLLTISMTLPVSASVITDRLKVVEKTYPNGSTIDKVINICYPYRVEKNIYDIRTCSNGGCNAFVSYATLKMYHNGYTPGTASFKKISKTALTTNNSQMISLFKKAKVGDVIRFHKGDDEYHFAIFKSVGSGGIYIDEANFGSKNKVWINHYWKWSDMKNWSMGATQVDVLRSYNYNKVNKKKAAKLLKKGTKFTYDGITYRVISNSLTGGKVKVVNINVAESATEGEVPKYIFVNNDTADYLKKFVEQNKEELFLSMSSEAIRYECYFADKYNKKRYKENAAGEQLFVVKK